MVELPEREIVKTVLNYFAHDSNVRVWRRNVGAAQTKNGNYVRFGVAGQSDIEGVIREIRCPYCGRLTGRGVHLEIECKRWGGWLSPAQKVYLGQIQLFGGVALVAIPEPTPTDPTGITALKKRLSAIGKETCLECSETRNRNPQAKRARARNTHSNAE